MLSFSSYLGGARDEGVTALAADREGNLYMAGWTTSPDLPVQSPLQASYGGPAGECPFFSATPCGDAFVAKIDPGGRLVYSTYLGGPGADFASAIAVDSTGHVYVAGGAGPGFPGAGGLQPAHGGGECFSGNRPRPCGDAFIAKIDPGGTRLIYSTYLGGAGDDAAAALAIDGSGHVYVAGSAGPGFPRSESAVNDYGGGDCGYGQPPSPCPDAFAAKIDPGGAGLVYSTYLGGPAADSANAIAVDSSGGAYLTGSAGPGFPMKASLDDRHGGGTCPLPTPPLIKRPCSDAFVARLHPDGGDIVFSTYLGGKAADAGAAIALDRAGAIYLTGSAGIGFPIKSSARRHSGGNCPIGRDPPVRQKCSDAFVAKLIPGGSRLAYSGYLGGSRADGGQAIVVDAGGSAYIAGFAGPGWPTTNRLQPAMGGKVDAIWAKLTPAGSAAQSAYIGGSGRERGEAIALGPNGAVHVAGHTDSPSDFPAVGALQTQGRGQLEGFFGRVTPSRAGGPVISRIVPVSGDTSGGTQVSIKGKGLKAASKVSFAEISASSYRVNSGGTEIKAVTPAVREGQTIVQVTTPQGTSPAAPGARFWFGAGHWSAMDAPARLHHSAALLPGGKVLVTGGCSRADSNGACADKAATRSALIFDPSQRSWQPAGSLKRARWGHLSILLPRGPAAVCGRHCGKVLVIGGDEGRLTSEVYDPQAETSVMLPATIDPRLAYGHTATLLPSGPPGLCGRNCGKVLLVVRGVIEFTTAGELLDIAREKWSPAGASASATALAAGDTGLFSRVTRSQHTATLLPTGDVLLLGGTSFVPATPGGPLAPAELFDPSTGSFTAAAEPATYRYAGHSATLLADGRVLAVGGMTDNIGTLTSSVEIYAPTPRSGSQAGGAWAPSGNLIDARYAHSATVLGDGAVLVAGGSDSTGEPRVSTDRGSALATAELYDPSTGKWRSAGVMAQGRGASVLLKGRDTLVSPAFAATPLGNGRVLVTGGGGSAELYAPPGVAAPGEPGQATRKAVPAWIIGAVAGAGLVLLAALGVWVTRRLRSRRGMPAGRE